MKRKFWLARNQFDESYYFLYNTKPKRYPNGNLCFPSIKAFCSRQWHHYTKIRLKPGEECRVEITVRKVKHGD